ncbi:hypothetical protein [Variovorax sp. PAMC26660]|uniref:hypothetical protein n=1 Tax=Variovorax sp. PAMC26660 TaxID=2762322 RepID=UPI00164E5AD7|nr:hypothetical protein [Variovorax sp. PAMC26660]QNK65819.1 hypothetical protein H7F35_21715 [Variovorax sp. PAMC26660]
MNGERNHCTPASSGFGFGEHFNFTQRFLSKTNGTGSSSGSFARHHGGKRIGLVTCSDKLLIEERLGMNSQ